MLIFEVSQVLVHQVNVICSLLCYLGFCHSPLLHLCLLHQQLLYLLQCRLFLQLFQLFQGYLWTVTRGNRTSCCFGCTILEALPTAEIERNPGAWWHSENDREPVFMQMVSIGS